MSPTDRAMPFISAALAGLCAQPKAHKPEDVAALAFDIGMAVEARLRVAFDDEEREERATAPNVQGRHRRADR